MGVGMEDQMAFSFEVDEGRRSEGVFLISFFYRPPALISMCRYGTGSLAGELGNMNSALEAITSNDSEVVAVLNCTQQSPQCDTKTNSNKQALALTFIERTERLV